MDVLKNFVFPRIDFRRDIFHPKIWFPHGKRLLANNMTGQADVRLCKLGGGWRLVKWMYQALFFLPRAKEAKKQKQKNNNNAWSQVTNKFEISLALKVTSSDNAGVTSQPYRHSLLRIIGQYLMKPKLNKIWGKEVETLKTYQAVAQAPSNSDLPEEA